MTLRALVVDDNAALAENIGEILAEEGFDVRVASDPRVALEMADSEPPDVALLDVRMPEMDGVTLHAELKKRAPRATFVLMTAFAADERIEAARKAGIRHVLSKPVPIDLLLEALRGGDDPQARILVVDDDALLRDALCELLREAGRPVDCAGLLAEARGLLERHAYAHIVLDVRLPDGDGIAFAEELTAAGNSVVLITGYEVEESARRRMDESGDASIVLLQKPFAPEKLLDAVRSLEVRG
ncbi:MAG: response regulator [Polyangiaceae bacterium]|nr:response regulator [Polyangiaceae bacterium]